MGKLLAIKLQLNELLDEKPNLYCLESGRNVNKLVEGEQNIEFEFSGTFKIEGLFKIGGLSVCKKQFATPVLMKDNCHYSVVL